MKTGRNILVRTVLTLLAASPRGHASDPPIQLRDVTGDSGIAFAHTDGSSGRRYIVETVASGLASFDYDRDGKIDLLFLNGAPLPGADLTNPPPRNALYRNEGNWKFKDVTLQAGLRDTNYHLGVCTADYNNDGFADIYLSNFGLNTLYRNNGDGTFTDVTREAGVGGREHVGAGVCFLDIDADGDLDLFAGSYVSFSYSIHHVTHMNGFPAYVGPLDYPSSRNTLYRNNGNGTFTDITEQAGLANLQGAAMGVISADIDNDGDADIVVGNDLRPNFLLLNDGTGRFKEAAGRLGIAYDAFGHVLGSMGVECADWNNDGWLDISITPYQRQLMTLFENQKGAFFDDVARKTGASAGTYADVKWGLGMVDFDNDGHRDLFIACGHLIDNVDLFDNSTRYKAPNILLRNTGNGKFENISDRSGDGLLPVFSSRGAIFDDLDNDGDVDVVILNARERPTLLRNDSNPRRHWLQVQLRGVRSNRDGIGARVSVKAGRSQWIDEVHSGRSYQSDFGKRLQFGLGDISAVDEVQVKWPGGGTDVLQNVKASQLLTIEQGKGMQDNP